VERQFSLLQLATLEGLANEQGARLLILQRDEISQAATQQWGIIASQEHTTGPIGFNDDAVGIHRQTACRQEIVQLGEAVAFRFSLLTCAPQLVVLPAELVQHFLPRCG
jgi:hypothetical protein